MLDELGPTFVKFGQLLSTRPDILPADIVQELVKLQDQVSPLEFSVVGQVIQEELGLTRRAGVRELRTRSHLPPPPSGKSMPPFCPGGSEWW